MATSNKIFVGNLSYSAKPEDLEQAFASFGTIHDVKIVIDRATGKSRGFGFVTFDTESEAKAALQMDQQNILDRKVRVNEAREKDK